MGVGRTVVGSFFWARLAAGVVGGSAFAGSRAEPVIPEGGTLHVNVTGTDFASLDPAINYDTDGAQFLYATCAKLASGMPRVSRDGLTYVFQKPLPL